MTLLLSGVKRIDADDQFETRTSGGEPQQNWDVRDGADNANELGVVDNVFTRLWTQSLIEGHGEERLRDGGEIYSKDISLAESPGCRW